MGRVMDMYEALARSELDRHPRLAQRLLEQIKKLRHFVDIGDIQTAVYGAMLTEETYQALRNEIREGKRR